MEGTVRAIVLKRTDQGESDRRLTLFSLERGKFDVVAKGARKAAGRLSALTEPLTVARFSMAEGKHNRFLTQAIPESAYRNLRLDYMRLTVALGTAELFAAILPYEQSDPEAFGLLEATIAGIDSADQPLAPAIWGQLQQLANGGFLPELSVCVASGQEVSDTDPWFSPSAGGIIRPAAATEDAYRMPSEVLFGLRRILEILEPPLRLKHAALTQVLLAPWWHRVAETRLPAFDSMVEALKQDLNASLAK